MNKKILLSLGAVLAVVAGVVGMAAYEAHIINVTAHIENALEVHPDQHIHFGTVFPQEYLERDFTIALSGSFKGQNRVDDVKYVIKQKPKCECIYWDSEDPTEVALCDGEQYAPVSYTSPHSCPTNYAEMKDLCYFLSKTNNDSDGFDPSGDPMSENDTGHPSYYVEDTSGDYCVKPGADAIGQLVNSTGDFSDLWKVDLKVPPVDGFIGQDWPAGCPTVANDSQDYGCDLWIEVTAIGSDI